MTWSLINSVSAAGQDSPFTSGSIDTTGADLIVVALVQTSGVAPIGITDSQGGQSNTYISVRAPTRYSGSNDYISLYFIHNPAHVGSGHTWSTVASQGGVQAAIFAAAFSGSAASNIAVLDKVIGAVNAFGTSQQTGSMTPNQNGCLLVSFAGFNYGGASGDTYTPNSGYTKIQQQSSTAITRGGAFAWTTQGTAAAINPSWSTTTASEINVAQVAFLPTGATAPSGIAFVNAADLGVGGPSTNTYSASYTVTTGNTLIVEVLGDNCNNGFTNLTSATYGGLDLTLLNTNVGLTTDGFNRWQYTYYLNDPPTGSNTLTVTFPTNHYMLVGVAEYSNMSVHDPGASANLQFVTTGTSISGSSTTTILNDWVISMEQGYSGGSQPSAGAGSTLRVMASVPNSGGWIICDHNADINPAASVNMTTNSQGGSSITMTMNVFAMQPVGGGSSPPPPVSSASGSANPIFRLRSPAWH